MKTMSKLGLSCLLAAFLALGAMGRSAAPAVLKAHADISGAPNSGISGTAVFVQIGTGILPTVQVIVTVEGLAPGSNHGFHVHENASCADSAGPPVVPFGGAGGHFDPGPFGNSTPPDTNHPFHMGDLPNLKADSDGRATFITTTSRITLAAGPLSILDANGSAVIVHALEDLGTTGQPPGAGGARIACGIVLKD
jgi:Cu-Zn family superoxide dismutase